MRKYRITYTLMIPGEPGIGTHFFFTDASSQLNARHKFEVAAAKCEGVEVRHSRTIEIHKHNAYIAARWQTADNTDNIHCLDTLQA